jgi:hypothetical protein
MCDRDFLSLSLSLSLFFCKAIFSITLCIIDVCVLSFFFIVLISITSSFSFCCLFLFFAYFFELRYKQEINRWIIDLYYDKIKLVLRILSLSNALDTVMTFSYLLGMRKIFSFKLSTNKMLSIMIDEKTKSKVDY